MICSQQRNDSKGIKAMRFALLVLLSSVCFDYVWAADHDYFNALVARPDHWKSYSMRNPTQLDRPVNGGYATSNNPDNLLWVTYNPAADFDPHRQDAAKVVIPSFLPVTTIVNAIGPTDTVIQLLTYSTSWNVAPKSEDIGRAAKIGSEIMIVVSGDRDTGKITVMRGKYGTVAASHVAGTVIQRNINSLPHQVRFPINPTSDGNTYFFTWDGYWTDSYLKTGLTNHKTFQFSSGGDGIWLEPNTLFSGAGTPGFNPETDVSAIQMRSYNTPDGPADWSLTNGDWMGPGTTNQPIGPKQNSFILKPNTWTRFWVRIEQRANDYDYMDFWVADENRHPIQIYNRIPISVRQTGNPVNSMVGFWLEYNTSTDYHLRLDGRNLVSYIRNFAALVNPPSDLSSLLQKPGSFSPLPVLPPSAPIIVTPPANKTVAEGSSAIFVVSVAGTFPFTYQWQVKSLRATGFSNISGATAENYAFPKVQLSDHGTQIRCVVTNGLGSTTSAAATLSVSGAATPPPPPPPTSGTPPPPPPPPTGTGSSVSLHMPSFVPVNSQISATFTGSVSPSYYSWSFSAVSATSSKFSARSGASAATFSTPSPVASLANLNLDLGTYLVSVTAYGSSGAAMGSASSQVTLVSANLDQVRVYPNPWRHDRHATRSVTFDSLTVNTEIKIFTVSGQHVRTLPMTSSNVTWDLKDEKGDKVASGIYLYVLKADDGRKKTGKMVVIQ
jgi:hypothetical protein